MATYSYTVVSGAGWRLTYDRFGNFTGIQASGTGGATIRVTGDYRCSAGGPVVASVSRDFNIGFSPTPLAPNFQIAANRFALCAGTTKQMACTEVPGATQYNWTVPAPFTSSQSVPGGRYINITAPGGDVFANVTISVTAVVPGCSSVSASKSVQIGYGGARVRSLEAVQVGSFNYVCADNLVTMRLEEDAVVTPSTNIVWSSNWNLPSGASPFKTGQGTGYVEVYTPPAGYNWQIAVSYSDGCGTSRIQRFYAFASNAPGGNVCSPIAQPRPAVYPNPVASVLTVEHLQGTATLYDSYGHPVLTGATHAGSAAHLNVQGLPAGLYYVVGRGTDGKPVRQAVQVSH